MNAVRSLFLLVFLSVSAPSIAGTGIDFDFAQIEVSAALQLIADVAGLNLRVGDDVTGVISMRMAGASWRDALLHVVQVKQLHHRISGGVLSVSRDPGYFDRGSFVAYVPDGRLVHPQSLHQVRHVLPTQAVAAFPVASDLGEQLLADDGSSMIVAHLSSSRVAELRDYLRAVDFPRQQVMIEARIVEVDVTYSRQLGVIWSAASTAGDVTLSTSGVLSSLPRSAPAAGLGWVADGVLLDLELAALEAEGRGRVISKPQVFASDRQLARVARGYEVPYQQSAGDGATSVAFKDASLSLQVRPVIGDGSVLLDLQLNKNEPDYSKALDGVPPINTASLTSVVRVPLGETVALGGVYSTSMQTRESRVPGLSSLPLIGGLFRYSYQSETTTELLLFVTPSLVPLQVAGQ